MTSPWNGALCALALAGLSLFPNVQNAQAARDRVENHAKVELVSEMQAIAPAAKEFWVGARFELEKGWHVYWRNPGDSGEAPRIEWELPPGFEAGPIEWPTPERIPYPPLVNYGYEGKVLFMVPIRVSADAAKTLQQGVKVDLKAKLRWLVCRESCVPGRGSYELPLEVHAAAANEGSNSQKLFRETREHLPKPLPAGWSMSAFDAKDHFTLEVTAPDVKDGALRKTVFFPATSEQIENATDQPVRKTPQGFRIQMKKSEQLQKSPAVLEGLLATSADRSYEIRSELKPAPASDLFETAPAKPAFDSIPLALLFAFIGGLILNLMPCVFPVLSIKVLGLVQQSGQERRENRAQGLAYTAGILVSFWVLVAALLIFRAGGEQLGWGFQLQSPAFLAVLACFLFLFGLNLLGVFEISSSVAGVGSSLASRGGMSGSFFTGVLATVVATPCSAPFMGSAIGFALTQGSVVAAAIFTSLALGLALPYLLLAYYPALGKVLPRPGRWMETVKQVLAFPIFATVIWLAWVFSLQVGSGAALFLWTGLLVVSIAAWMVGRWPTRVGVRVAGVILFFLALGISLSGERTQPGEAEGASSLRSYGLTWEKFSPELVAKYRAEGRPIFVDFTAAWCVTCQVNERLVFRNEQVQTKLKEQNVALLKADWTSHDPVITEALASFGKSGVPVYVLYRKGATSAPHIFPELINASMVLAELEKLGQAH